MCFTFDFVATAYGPRYSPGMISWREKNVHINGQWKDETSGLEVK